MKKEDLLQQLEQWRVRFIQEVIPFYRQGDGDRGRFAYNRWKEGLVTFLKENLPSESEKFLRSVTHSAFVGIRGETVFEKFMREYGNTCIAFIDELISAVEKNRLLPEKPITTTPPQIVTSSSPEREPGVYITWRKLYFVGRIVFAFALAIGCYFVYQLPQIQSWTWLQNHPNKLGLYISAGALALSVIMSIIFPQRWQYWLGTFGVSIFAVVVQIV